MLPTSIINIATNKIDRHSRTCARIERAHIRMLLYYRYNGEREREREKKKNASKRKEEEKNLLVFLGSLWVVHDRAKRKLNK